MKHFTSAIASAVLVFSETRWPEEASQHRPRSSPKKPSLKKLKARAKGKAQRKARKQRRQP